MRRPLLTLLALLVLLMQPAALLHGLSHLQGGQHGSHGGHGVMTAVVQDHAASHGHGNPGDANGLDCLQCLAFAAIGSAALPAALLLFRTPLLRHALPGGRERALRGGTGAGYHARGPPALA